MRTVSYAVRRARRMLRVLSSFPAARKVWLLKLAGLLPFCRFTYTRFSSPDPNRPGHADGYSQCKLTVLGKKVWQLDLQEGADLSAYHFYLARSLRPFWESLPDLDWPTLTQKGPILEIGCGPGKVLSAMVDRFGGKGIGIDAHQDSLRVARSIALQSELEFHHEFIRTGSEIDIFLNKNPSVVMFSSSFVHIPDRDNCRSTLMHALKARASAVVGVERPAEDMLTFLKDHGFQVTMTEDAMVFIWSRPC